MIIAWQMQPRLLSGANLMNSLSAEEARSGLARLPGWKIEAGELVRSFEFKDFLAALRFVNQVAEVAEKAGHHPDIDIRYNKVRLGLVTHDAGGLTAKDFDLAGQANALAG
jgi:4a-hydroxytetrahydrobiopterin dehydratase